MSLAALIPIHLDAMVLGSTQSFEPPRLDGAPFAGEPAPVLAPGVHLHWALPDALCAAAQDGDGVRFPAVPDLWLVVRYGAPQRDRPRSLRAWIVDAYTGSTTDLANWQPRPVQFGRDWLTAVGHRPGGVVGGQARLSREDLHRFAYYPASRNRFAFHDPVEFGPVSYLVVGWYASPDEDPLHRAGAERARRAWARRSGWQFSESEAVRAAATAVDPRRTETAPVAFADMKWNSDTTWFQPFDPNILALALDRNVGLLDGLAVAARPRAVSQKIVKFPDHIVCHGAVVDVAIKGVGGTYNEPRPTPTPAARLSPSLERAAEQLLASGPEAALAAQSARTPAGELQRSEAIAALAHRRHETEFIAHAGPPVGADEPPPPRYFRPAAPVLTLANCRRSFRHGEDGRLDPERKKAQPGRLFCRTGPEIVRVLRRDFPVWDSSRRDFRNERVDIKPEALPSWMSAALAPVPQGAALVQELALLDPANSPRLAKATIAALGLDEQQFLEPLKGTLRYFCESVIKSGDPTDRQAQEVLAADRARGAFGEQPAAPPSPIALAPWREPWAPLFCDIRWSFKPIAGRRGPGDLRGAFRLDRADYEPEPDARTDAAPLAGSARRAVSTAIADLISQIVDEPDKPAPHRDLDLLSVALDELDEAIPGPLRAGTLEIDAIQIVDSFGRVVQVPLPAPLSLLLRPRLTSWSRLLFRLVAARDGAREADRSAPPVAGFLLPDHVEHALEVFDPEGRRLGQLRHRADRVVWEPCPFAAIVDPAVPWDDPRRTIRADDEACACLLRLVLDVLEQPAPEPGKHDTALSALLRVIDTTLATVRTDGSTEYQGALLAHPVAVVKARLRLETLPRGADPARAPGSDPRPTPRGLQVQVGSLLQSDDGLLGFYAPRSPDRLGRLRAVDPAVLQEARASGPALESTARTKPAPRPIDHPYVDSDPRIDLPADQDIPLVLLMEPHGKVYVHCGVVPRKSITLPAEFLQPALSAVAPLFTAGPVLLPAGKTLLPLPPVGEGKWRWVHLEKDGAARATARVRVDEVAGADGLTGGTSEAQDGWLMFHGKVDAKLPDVVELPASPDGMVTIEAGALTSGRFMIPGVSTDWLDGAAPQRLRLAPGTYGFHSGTGHAAFTFTVTARGSVTYEPRWEGVLAGRDSARLSVRGVTIEIVTSGLDNPTFIIPGVTDAWLDGTTPQRLQVVPATYHVMNGPAGFAPFTFSVSEHGTVHYGPEWEGALGGQGTNRLEIRGLTIRIDTSALTGKSFIVPGVTGTWVDGSTRPALHLSPGTHPYQVVAGWAPFMFTVDAAGAVGYDGQWDGVLGGRGTDTLIVHGARIEIDTSGLDNPHFIIPGVTDTWVDGSTPQGLQVVPATYYFQNGPTGYAPFTFSVGEHGTVHYDPQWEGVLGGQGTRRLVVRDPSRVPHTIGIDVSALTYRRFIIPGVLPDWVQGDAPQRIQLRPGTYVLRTPAGPEFSFQVTDDGKVEHDDALVSILDGRGTNTLVVRGVEVGVDATALTYRRFIIPGAVPDWVQSDAPQRIRLLSGTYVFRTPAGSEFVFRVTDDGTIAHDDALAPMLDGRGTDTLVVRGVEVGVDASALTYRRFIIPGAVPDWVQSDAPQRIRLLPGTYVFRTPAGSEFVFRVTDDGTIAHDDALVLLLAGRGTDTLVVRGVEVGVDASALTYRRFIILGAVPDWIQSDAPQRIRLLPGTYVFRTPAGSEFVFRVTDDGTIAHDDALAPILAGRGTDTLVVRGVEVGVDATALTYRRFIIPGAVPDWVQSDAPQRIRLLPGTYVFRTPAGSEFVFRVTDDGTIAHDDALVSLLAGRGTDTLIVRGVEVGVDATALTYRRFIIPGAVPDWVQSDAPQRIRLLPGTYVLRTSESVDFVFRVTASALIDYEARFDGALQGQGTGTLVVTSA